MSGEAVCAFPPIVGREPHTLILGTMPGGKSLLHQQYYAHPQNQFWRLMGDLYGAGRDLPYDRRLIRLKEQGIAVWDVLSSCKREGSMDADITEPVVNDFPAFFRQYPTIRRVIFDSLTAENLYRRHIVPPPPLVYSRVPSPSPAYARLRYEEKLALWRDVLVGRSG